MAPFLELNRIRKTYGDLVACDDVSLSVERGEIHALLGENGAGKSTLVKMMYGYVRPDAGSILLDGTPTEIANPADARALGIEMVFQHFSLFETLSVAENLALASDNRQTLPQISAKITEASETYGLQIHPEKRVIDLSVGERQRVEIIRCLIQKPKLLIMDEPTSVLTPVECDTLFETLRRFCRDTMAVLYISHKLEEIQALCHKATILRRGQKITECDPQVESQERMAEMMIGKPPEAIVKRTAVDRTGQPYFRVNGLSASSKEPFGTDIKAVSFDVFSGEIVGIAGVSGNGQNLLCDLLSGLVTSDRAESLMLNGQPIGTLTINQRRRLGLAYVPEDRQHEGSVNELSLTENALLTGYLKQDARVLGFIRYQSAGETTRQIIADFDVRTAGAAAPAGSLSGGNLQKFIVGRELGYTPKLLVIAAPTWGIDAGAEAFVRQKIVDAAADGAAVILISQDLDEVFEISDRIAVMYDGKLSPAFFPEALTREKVGLLMGGSDSFAAA